MPRFATVSGGVVRRLSLAQHHPDALPVVSEPPAFDPDTQRLHLNPPEQWAVFEDRVEVTYTIEERDLEAEAAALQAYREGLEVSRFQARAVLRQIGLREQVEAIMADPDTDPLMVDAWQDAQVFRRLSPTIQALAAILDLSDEQVDSMFEQASQIDA